MEAIRIQDEIYARVSHELRTPLHGIFGTIQLMELSLKDPLTDDSKNILSKHVGRIKQNCYRLIKLIRNIEDLHQIESGFFPIKLENLNIVEVVDGIVQAVVEHVHEKEVKLTFDTEVEELYLACDEEKVERILLNLISNAYKFTNAGGTIHVEVSEKENCAVLLVRDNGVGIEQHELESIFQRYHQAGKTLSRHAEGTGAGLTLVKSLVELQGGRISAESQIGKGSTFTVAVPIRLIGDPAEKGKTRRVDSIEERIQMEFSDLR